MDEPRILRFPISEPLAPPACDQLDLQSILAAWNEATDRLQQTHETLRAEVSRLTEGGAETAGGRANCE